jgi:hypothetical protein
VKNYKNKTAEWSKTGISKKDFDKEFGDEIKTLKAMSKTGELLPLWK